MALKRAGPMYVSTEKSHLMTIFLLHNSMNLYFRLWIMHVGDRFSYFSCGY